MAPFFYTELRFKPAEDPRQLTPTNAWQIRNSENVGVDGQQTITQVKSEGNSFIKTIVN